MEHLVQKIGAWRCDETHHVDARSGLAGLPDGSVSLVVTSPPYWGQRGSVGLGSEADPREYLTKLTTVLAEAMRVLDPLGLLWLNLGDAYNTPINWRPSDHAYSSLGAQGTGLSPSNSAYRKDRGRRRAFVDEEDAWLQYGNLLNLPHRLVVELCDRGFLFRGEVIWAKARPLPEGRCRRPHRSHEPILIFAATEKHRFRVTPPVRSVWDIVQTPGRTQHHSVFPVDLPRRCISASAVPSNGVVLDPFMGSGTTAVAAQEAGLHFIGFDSDAEAVRAANQRAWEAPLTLTQAG